MMKNKKILVTGGAGYIGSHVVKELIQEGFKVVVYDNLSTGNKSAVGQAKLVIGDLSEVDKLDRLIQEEKFDGVMHFAGSIIVPESVENPILYYQNNTVNSLNLMSLCLKNNVMNFIFSSTAAVYGMLAEGLATETTKTEPINPYGESKLMTEKMLRDVSIAHKEFKYIAFRYFNVCGADPAGQIGQAFPGATHLIKVSCEAATGKREAVTIFGTDFDTIDGTGVRDYIHVSDLASAHVLGLKYLFKEKVSHTLNCGYGKGFSVREVITAVQRVTGKSYPVHESARREGDPDSLIAKVDKIKDVLAWKPKYNNLDIMIETAYRWETSDVYKKWDKS